MAARRRDILRDLTNNAKRLRDEGEMDFAEQVERFARELPPLDTERRKMQRAILTQVEERLRQQYDKSKLLDQNNISRVNGSDERDITD
jgi:anti-sigma-K factor RskA